jgi:flagellar basal-body rod protein FlgB
MTNLTVALIAKALDGLQARQAATAQNIANANSESYRPVRVTFEDSLRAAAAQGPEAVAGVIAKTEFAPVPRIASEMRLDLEIATAAQTAMRYGALVSVLEGRGGMMRAVIDYSYQLKNATTPQIMRIQQAAPNGTITIVPPAAVRPVYTIRP